MILLDHWRHSAIRARDEHDRLCAAGFRGDERRLFQHVGIATIAFASSTITPLVLASKGQPGAIVAALVGLPFLVGLVWVVRHPKTLIFTREGRVLTPNGIAGRFWKRELGRIAEVSSIEVTAACRSFGVVLFTTEGHTILLAERMFKADARVVAVQLTKALQEMRVSIASIGNNQSGAERAPVWVH